LLTVASERLKWLCYPAITNRAPIYLLLDAACRVFKASFSVS